MRKRSFQALLYIALCTILISNGCVLPAQRSADQAPLSSRYETWLRTLTTSDDEIVGPIAEQTYPSSSSVGDSDPNLIAGSTSKVYLHPGLPDKIITALNLPQSSSAVDIENAEVSVLLGKPDPGREVTTERTWIYVLVAPFYTATDDFSSDALAALWRGETPNHPSFEQILVSSETDAVMREWFGVPDESIVKLSTQDEINQLALSDQAFLAILPFEELNPHWKLLRVDGQSPLDDAFSTENYPFSVEVWIQGGSDAVSLVLPPDNYNPEKRTVLLMTGVTALTRATAHRMEVHGNHYPGQDIQAWFSAADLVHISNEVPFAENCPYPNPVQTDLIFCSSPDRIELLEYISADIIELSGNHLLDYGVPAMNLTLEMYAERGWETFAGGWNLADARSPALITHNGNRLAFIGCNPVGPPNVWATDSQPGSAPCGDYQWMLAEIRALKDEGYLPIVTVQYAEDYTAYPSAKMRADFQQLADAGAVMVSGSQAHTPKTMVFYNGSFLHYGLGNLFFDQMEVYYSGYLMPGTREAFIDRLVFYDGRLISVELLTTMLEDYARPRPMSSIERNALLSRIFELAIESYE